jgi:predicted CoA-binding protein
MKRLTRDEVRIERMLRAARSVAVLGCGSGRGRAGEALVEYLKNAGFDVYPVREDRAEVAGLASWATLADVPGSLDIVLVVARAALDAAAVEAAARKHARALWLAPGVPAGAAAALAARHGLALVHGRDIVAEHRHTEQVAGQPRKRGVHVSLRKQRYEDDRKRVDEIGYIAGGGGGRHGGGGKRAVLDEKKMLDGKPSPRGGRLRRSGDPA